MANYRRNLSPGGTYFFTVALANRRTGLLTRYISELRGAFVSVQQRFPFYIDAIVILPDHLHCVITLPPRDADYPLRWRRIKTKFSSAVPRREPRSASRVKKR